MARKRSRKPKIVGTMVVDGKEIPVIGWLEPERALQRSRRAQQKAERNLEREWRELWKDMRKVKPFSLLEIFVRQREAVRGWETGK